MELLSDSASLTTCLIFSEWLESFWRRYWSSVSSGNADFLLYSLARVFPSSLNAPAAEPGLLPAELPPGLSSRLGHLLLEEVWECEPAYYFKQCLTDWLFMPDNLPRLPCLLSAPPPVDNSDHCHPQTALPCLLLNRVVSGYALFFRKVSGCCNYLGANCEPGPGCGRHRTQPVVKYYII